MKINSSLTPVIRPVIRATLILIVILGFFGQATVFADSYILDPKAVVHERTGPFPFKDPDDPKVCKLYLENLNYFARKNQRLDCDRPVAPHLGKHIQRVEWENLDPKRYAALFREVVSVTRYGGSRLPSDEDVESALKRLQEGHFVFRRTKTPLVGRVIAAETVNGVYRQISVPSAPITYYLVQAGDYYCQSDDRQTGLFQTPISLESIYSGFVVQHSNLIGNELVQINGRLYAELVRDDNSIELQESSTSYPTMLNSVCMFQFKRSVPRRR